MLGKLMHPHKQQQENDNHAAIEHAKTAVEPKQEIQAPAPKQTNFDEGNKLIVGPNIKLKGTEITDCEILVVEGRVEASMNSRDIRIAEGGVFSGKAEIDVAEIRGHFEGELTARKRLTVYATGRVTGQIHYGALMIEEGGILSGEVGAIQKDKSAPKLKDSSKDLPTLPLAEITKPHPYRPPVLGPSQLGSRRG